MLQIQITVDQLVKGMYVSKLDRPWVETPFLFQGFMINSEEQIRQLQEHCAFVFVDGERGALPDPSHEAAVPRPDVPPAPLPKPRANYDIKSDYASEIGTAKSSYKEVTEEVGSFFNAVRHGQLPEIATLSAKVADMEESILRNPDAFMWLRRMKTKGTYTYSHSIGTSVLAIAFGRQMGLARSQIHDLGLGALMADVGKVKLPESLLNKPGPLSDPEFLVAKRHVNFGVDIVEGMRGVSGQVVSVVATHHERFDGGGYPKGLAGGDIPLLGRMVAIVDMFDAITSERPYASAAAPDFAIRQLYAARNTAYQDELVEHFIQLLGLYPVGSLVELNTGEVGIVIEQNRVRRLRPKIVLLLGSDKKTAKGSPTLDLMKHTVNDKGEKVNISRSLPPGSYDIDPDEFYL